MKKVILFFIIFNFLISFSFAQIVNNRNVLNLKAQVLDDRVENNNNSNNNNNNNNNGNNGGYVFNNLNISIPLELGAFSGKNALILKNLGNGPYSPFFSFFPGLTKFSMRADNDNLYFGVGDEAGFDPKISISKDGNLLIGASRGGNFLLFGYQNMIRAGIRFNPASGKLEYSNNVADPTSWKEFGFGTTTIIHTTTIIYQGSTSSPNLTLPLVLQGGSGINGIVLKNSGGGINAPFLTWESLGQKFSIRSDNNYLYFGSGDMAGFNDYLSISKNGEIVLGGSQSRPLYFAFNKAYKAGIRYNPQTQKLEYSHNVNDPNSWQAFGVSTSTIINNQPSFNEIFKDERATKGVVSFPVNLGPDFEPIILHGGGAQVIGRNAYYDERNRVWKYYKGDAAAYAISFGGGNETLNEVETRMRIQAAPLSDADKIIRWETALSIMQDGNVMVGGDKNSKNLYFGYNYQPKAGIRYNPQTQKLEFSHNIADPTSWKEFGFGTTTIIHTTTIIYQGSTSSPNLTLPLVLQGGSGINGIVLKNSGGGINAPFLTWESLGQKFSIRSDNNYLYFGSGDMAGFRDVLSISKDGDVIVRKIVSQIGGYTYYEYQKGGTVIQNWNLQKDRKFNFSSDWGISNLYRMNCDSDLKINCNNDNYLSNAGEPNEKYDLFIDVQVDTNSCSGRDCTNYCYAAILNDRILASAPNYCIYKPGYVVFNKVEKRSGGNNIVKGGNLKVENDLTIGGNLKFDNGVFIGTRVIPNGTSKYCGATQYANVSVFVENNKIKFKVCKKSGGCEVQEAILKPQFVDPNAEALNYNMFNISGVHLLISWGYIGRPSTFLRYYNNSWIATDDRNVSSFVYPEQAAYILEASGDTVLKRMICSFD